MERFKITQVNPNDGIGGGGCVCGDTKVEGCDPPYAVFYATETDNNLSPHVVICKRCAASVVEQAEADPDSQVVDTTAEEVVEPEVEEVAIVSVGENQVIL